MKSRLWLALLVLPCGCWPHETRPLADDESCVVERACTLIAEHALRSNDPIVLSVSRAIEEARRSDRIGAFEDEGRLPDGSRWEGAVSARRLYLHRSVLDGSRSLETRSCPYPVEILYHEGVHLTQSCVTLLLAPETAERRAKEETRRFLESWDRGHR